MVFRLEYLSKSIIISLFSSLELPLLLQVHLIILFTYFCEKSILLHLLLPIFSLALIKKLCYGPRIHHLVLQFTGGGNPQPGEISLSHNGVLFLDELPEFKRTVLEVMRQPLEERRVTISRAKVSIDFPANFMLIASMNPCPCGYYNHPDKECVCGPGVVQKYLNKVSGPLLDRIDLHVEVTPVTFDQMTETRRAETSHDIQQRVEKARAVQTKRFAEQADIHSNAMMPSQMVKDICQISDAGRKLLKTAMERLGLSARAYDRILKVARTIADLAGTEEIQIQHLAEAIQYRSLDREGWAG
jgi:magnesium chelatase family protein